MRQNPHVRICGGPGSATTLVYPTILRADMTLIRRLVWWLGQELARRPEARAKAKEVLAETQRVLNDDVKPRAKQAWRDAQPNRDSQTQAEELRRGIPRGVSQGA